MSDNQTYFVYLSLMPTNRVHLVLSSGGIKCLSYAGAIRKLHDNGIAIASVSTCSFGSVVGTLLCSGMDPATLENTLLHIKYSRLSKRKFGWWLNFLRYPYSAHKVPDFTQTIIDITGKDLTLGDMQIPFAAAAVDLRKERMLVYSSETHPEMKAAEVIRIATAIPPISAPYEKDRHLLVDAGVATQSPVWMAANYPEQYPIVVLKPDKLPTDEYKRGLGEFIQKLFAASAASNDYYTASQISRITEVTINCGNINATDFTITKDQIQTMMSRGEVAMESKLRDFGGNFNRLLDIEEITLSPTNQEDTAMRAEAVARRIMKKYHTEAQGRSHVFISYSHDDRPWLEKLQTYMRGVERFTGIKTWDDTLIQPGNDWRSAIENALRYTQVAVFLVTPNFLASKFIVEEEMQYFLDISKKERVPILWIAVSSSLYEITPLAEIQCANDPQAPLDQMTTEGEQNKALTEISKKIIEAMDDPGQFLGRRPISPV